VPGEMPRTPSKRIAAALRASIARGEYKPGTRLPSILDLSEAYGVSTETAAKVLHLLAADGLAEARRGRGHYVPEELPAALEPPASGVPPAVSAESVMRQRAISASRVGAAGERERPASPAG
jgi:GntR family transcriptional regulator